MQWVLLHRALRVFEAAFSFHKTLVRTRTDLTLPPHFRYASLRGSDGIINARTDFVFYSTPRTVQLVFRDFLSSATGLYQTREASVSEIQSFRARLKNMFFCADSRGFAHGVPGYAESSQDSKGRRRLLVHKAPPLSVSVLDDENVLGSAAVLWGAASKLLLPDSRMFERGKEGAPFHLGKSVRLQCGCHVSAFSLVHAPTTIS